MSNSYEGFYGGGFSALSSDYGNLNNGYQLNASMLGFPGSPQSANQIQDTVNAIKHGTKVFEVTMLQPDVAETIPTQHFEEMRALMKLTGVKPSVHAPVIDAVGFGEQGWGKEEGRADNERRMFSAIEKAQVLDSSGKLPIVFHATNGTPGNVWRPWDKNKDREYEKDEFGRVLESGAMINQETGQVQAIKRELKWRPEVFNEELKKYGEYGKEALFDVRGSLGSANLGDWETKLTEIAQMNKHAEELIGAAPVHLAEYKDARNTKDGIIGVDKDGNERKLQDIKKGTGQAESYNQMYKAGLFLDNAELSFKSTFGKAYKYGSPEQQKELEKLANSYTKELKKTEDLVWNPIERQRLLDNAIITLQGLTSGKIIKDGKLQRDDRFGAPKIYKLSEDLALEEASKTFGNLAIKSYDKFKEKAPILAIENVYDTQALSSADSLKKLVEASRDRMVEGLKDKGVNEKKARKLAEDKIGVTWDVGHLNLVRRKGFDEKEILRQTKLINKDKSMVKHIHLTDNFGFADTHLVPGMGNVPVKAILEELEKNGRFDEMKKITEAGGIVQHFKKLPHSMTMAAFGSGIYGMKAGPTWGAAMDTQGVYFGGYGNLNPQTHHSYFGAGFTTMPVELGGQMAGGGSRFGGTPMA